MSHVQDNYNKMTAAIKQTDIGKNAEKRDFCLLPVMLFTLLLKGSAVLKDIALLAIFLDKLPPQLAAELKKVAAHYYSLQYAYHRQPLKKKSKNLFNQKYILNFIHNSQVRMHSLRQQRNSYSH